MIVPSPAEIIFHGCDGTKVPFSLEAARICEIAGPFFCTVEEDTDDDGDDDDVKQPMMPITGTIITVPITGTTLQKVAIFCERYVDYPDDRPNIVKPFTSYHIEELAPEWYTDFVTKITLELLFDLMKAANYMGIEPLQELVLVPVAMLIEKKAYAGNLPSLFDLPRLFDKLEITNQNDSSTNIEELGKEGMKDCKEKKKRRKRSKQMKERLKQARQSLR